ncbi:MULTISPECIES: ABC transporter ATP-binding protein [unclassified Brenneria]|uniref:ABC transporter ATP-binding protein n=1 Tax=unclassified Brenneria TaxID=2634434 RepID=UPI0015545C04|nr:MULTISPECIES: ABC transporter ATP-binding protein [unclassified Brenneria]MBJ7223686.1 ABC transporter ATP-binding protein [Brenneria sp. L3-3C-1]MEE3644928.1 ABC transporter ATP-binding protein [Brenneria sp. L3_3C_1]MEE3652322.1 ABC transporter ATP-binding protein [Brenneria sp. HEZEL_4_2_4]NPD02279.1 ABC transporter ATP-binding protein [Brenneria sp. hezel4-2-4]
MTQDIILETQGLGKRFGGAQVINQVDMQIRRGEIRCVIGPNGAGKSTFFKLLTGEHAPSSGEIRFFGQRLNALPPFQRIRMGMSIKFQIPGIFPDLSVEQHLRLSLRHLRPEARHQPASMDELLHRFNLTDEYRQRAGNLSHGKKQWLEIAMAVSLQPELLMLDEPVAGLSVEETYLTGELIKQMRQDGLTLMVVEHDMTFVRQIASRVTVLHGGQVFADGAADAVLARDDVTDIYLGKAG